jgi:hypothetical protein
MSTEEETRTRRWQRKQGKQRGKQNHNDNGKKTKGHAEANCRGKPGNENKTPQWLKNKEQVSAALGRSTAPELLLQTKKLPTLMSMLRAG